MHIKFEALNWCYQATKRKLQSKRDPRGRCVLLRGGSPLGHLYRRAGRWVEVREGDLHTHAGNLPFLLTNRVTYMGQGSLYLPVLAHSSF